MDRRSLLGCDVHLCKQAEVAAETDPAGHVGKRLSGVCETLGNDLRTDEIRILALAQEGRNGGGEGCAECVSMNRGDVGVLESSKGLGGQVVVAASLNSR